MQSFLAASFQSRNIHRFRLALLLSDVSPDLPDVDADGQLSIFEQCCRTPGYHEFVRECIRWGCDINKVRHQSAVYVTFMLITTHFSPDTPHRKTLSPSARPSTLPSTRATWTTSERCSRIPCPRWPIVSNAIVTAPQWVLRRRPLMLTSKRLASQPTVVALRTAPNRRRRRRPARPKRSALPRTLRKRTNRLHWSPSRRSPNWRAT